MTDALSNTVVSNTVILPAPATPERSSWRVCLRVLLDTLGIRGSLLIERKRWRVPPPKRERETHEQ